MEAGRRKIRFIPFIWMFLGGICAWVVAECISNNSADEYVDYYGSDVFKNAVSVAETSVAVLHALDQSPHVSCSPEDLEAMRRIVFVVPLLADVGRLREGELACTGVWGTFATPVAMPPISRVIGVNAATLWRGASGVVRGDLAADMASFGDSVVMTEASAFARYRDPAERLAALVLTSDGSYVYQAFGETYGLSGILGQSSRWYHFARRRVFSHCDDNIDVCVVATYAAPTPLETAPLDFLLVLAGGMTAGGCIGLWHARLYGESRSWRQKLQRALDNNRLTVHYQPIIRLSDSTLCGAEALVRLVDFDGTLIPPDQFIPAAEASGVVEQITRRVVKRAFSDMGPRLSADRDFYLSINVSSDDILNRDFLGFLDNETKARGVSPGQVALELTERSTASPERLTRAMEEFSRNGYQFLIDDFGTGYSSLSYIARMPISGIKIDRMFTQALDQPSVGAVIVSKVCELAAALKVTLICEGVETKAQATILANIYPDICAQGFLIGRPMPVERFSRTFPVASRFRWHQDGAA
ncbi:EAL domain-containing protein [Martelella lutilitoris]|uniref:cyclic-guanylate-specific phosphodiesterase n=1 Tax=Martelella lutilitoris TaxID=2583532 RepID=A0A5C4JLQ7_9HYPH|nr:EAL domain-containing protein [Martelella lutilitoris]TNB46278.1 EAL domain-containing protein [Martelella lutilitoris]